MKADPSRTHVWLASLCVLALVGCAEVSVLPPNDDGGAGQGGASEPPPPVDCEVTDSCPVTCEAGFENCDARSSNGCEAELDVDAHHCGACDNDCGTWGDCFAGQCVEVLATTVGGFVGANALVPIGDDLYFSSGGLDLHGGLVARVPLVGGPVETLSFGITFPERLVNSGDTLAFDSIVDPGVFTVSVAGGPVTTPWLPGSGESARVLAMKEGSVYFTTGTDVRRLTLVSGAVAVVAQGLVDVESAVVADNALWITDLGPEIAVDDQGHTTMGHPYGTIAHVDLTSGTVTTLATNLDTPHAVLPVGNNIVWVEGGNRASYDDGGDYGTFGRVMRAGLDGSSPTLLMDDLTQPVDLAVDDSGAWVFVAEAGTVLGVQDGSDAFLSQGRVLALPIAGGEPRTLVPNIDARRVAFAKGRVVFSSWVYNLIMSVAAP
ncbi:MAG: hypothetical protein U0271_34975 [Polyangiaceae bacterium]